MFNVFAFEQKTRKEGDDKRHQERQDKANNQTPVQKCNSPPSL
jgi:hypothetical protein